MMDNDPEKRALLRKVVLGAAVFTGLLGVVALLKIIPLPPIVGYTLLGMGVIDAIVALVIFRDR